MDYRQENTVACSPVWHSGIDPPGGVVRRFEQVRDLPQFTDSELSIQGIALNYIYTNAIAEMFSIPGGVPFVYDLCLKVLVALESDATLVIDYWKINSALQTVRTQITAICDGLITYGIGEDATPSSRMDYLPTVERKSSVRCN